MATPGLKKSSKEWNKVSVNSAVQWCCYVLLLALCGYSLYRQHGLERRLQLLEQQHGGLRRLVTALQQPTLRRRRDVTDCICPQAGYVCSAKRLLGRVQKAPCAIKVCANSRGDATRRQVRFMVTRRPSFFPVYPLFVNIAVAAGSRHSLCGANALL
ncbi:hypothetical protein RR46_07353 [Papilio xuthus]|uniref:Uncharacterized protein n=1 Tax=Papilio xuthus TaxID=66420 RepID=A0A194PW51_PAPXU|nr:hypothetical protein RR46_07353 [Papilio xuthus]